MDDSRAIGASGWPATVVLSPESLGVNPNAPARLDEALRLARSHVDGTLGDRLLEAQVAKALVFDFGAAIAVRDVMRMKLGRVDRVGVPSPLAAAVAQSLAPGVQTAIVTTSRSSRRPWQAWKSAFARDPQPAKGTTVVCLVRAPLHVEMATRLYSALGGRAGGTRLIAILDRSRLLDTGPLEKLGADLFSLYDLLGVLPAWRVNRIVRSVDDAIDRGRHAIILMERLHRRLARTVGRAGVDSWLALDHFSLPELVGAELARRSGWRSVAVHHGVVGDTPFEGDLPFDDVAVFGYRNVEMSRKRGVEATSLHPLGMVQPLPERSPTDSDRAHGILLVVSQPAVGGITVARKVETISEIVQLWISNGSRRRVTLALHPLEEPSELMHRLPGAVTRRLEVTRGARSSDLSAADAVAGFHSTVLLTARAMGVPVISMSLTPNTDIVEFLRYGVVSYGAETKVLEQWCRTPRLARGERPFCEYLAATDAANPIANLVRGST